MKKNTIVFISGYDNSDKYINGFIQMFNLFKNDNYYNSILLKVDTLWKKSDRINIRNKSIKIFFPFSKYDMNSFLKKWFIYIPTFQESIDIMIFDSDPYSLLIHKEIINFYKPKKVIYRQSDPMILIDRKGLIAQYELELMRASNQVWVANKVIKGKMDKYNLLNVYVLENPIKLPSSIELKFDNNMPLIEKVMKIKKEFTNIGIFYGKYSIDYDLIAKIANNFQDTAFLIIGNYSCAYELPNNVYLMSYQPIDEIVMAIKLSDFFFIPNTIVSHKDIFYMTSKILMAARLNKPIIAQGISAALVDLDINVGNGPDYFIDKICQLKNLSAPNIDLELYSEDSFLDTALTYINKL